MANQEDATYVGGPGSIDGEEINPKKVGSKDDPAESVNTEKLDNVRHASAFDGADGGEQIQAAINDLPSSGGKVIIGPNGPDSGKWVFSSTVNINKDNVTVQGVGLATQLKLADGADAKMIDFTNQNDITFRDFDIDGNRANQTNSGTDNHVELIDSYGGSKRILVSNIYFHDVVNCCFNLDYDSGSNYDRHKHVVVTNCYFDNNYDGTESGYKPGEDAVEFKTTDYGIVTNCTFTQVNKTAVEIERSKHCVVSNNVLEDTCWNEEAVLIGSPGSGSDLGENITITGNVFKNIHEKAISFNGTKQGVASGNTIEDTDAQGIKVGDGANGITAKNILITGNVIRRPTNYGVYASAKVNGLQISENALYNGSKGIILEGGQDGAVVRGNRIRSTTNASIEVINGSNNAVLDNFIRGAGGHGIVVSGLTDSEVVGNRVLGVSSHGINAISGGSEYLFADNVTRNSSNSGIRLDGPTDSEVVGNKFDEGTALTLTSNSGGIDVLDNLGLSSVSNSASNVLFLWNRGHDDTLASAPFSSPSAGDIYFDDGTNTSDGNPHLRYYNGTSYSDM